MLLQSEIEKLKRQIAEKEAAVKAAQAQMPAAKVCTAAQTEPVVVCVWQWCRGLLSRVMGSV